MKKQMNVAKVEKLFPINEHCESYIRGGYYSKENRSKNFICIGAERYRSREVVFNNEPKNH